MNINADDIEIIIKSREEIVFKKKVDNMISLIDNAYVNIGEYDTNDLMNSLCRIVENTTLIATIQALASLSEQQEFKDVLDKAQSGKINLKARNIKNMLKDIQKKLFLSSFENAMNEMNNIIIEKVTKELDIKDEKDKSDYQFTVKVFEGDKLYKTLNANNLALCSPDAGSMFVSNLDDEDERASEAHSIATNMLSYLAMYIVCTLSGDNVYKFSEKIAKNSRDYDAFMMTITDIYNSVKDFHKAEYIQNKMKEAGPGQMIIDKEAYVDAMLKEQRDKLLASLDELQDLPDDSE